MAKEAEAQKLLIMLRMTTGNSPGYRPLNTDFTTRQRRVELVANYYLSMNRLMIKQMPARKVSEM